MLAMLSQPIRRRRRRGPGLGSGLSESDIDVPLELWQHIFSFACANSLKSLTLTCRTFCAFAQPFLVRKFTIFPLDVPHVKDLTTQQMKTVDARFEFFRRPNIAPAITECRIIPPDMSDSESGVGVIQARKWVKNTITTALHTVSLFPHLAKLRLHEIQFTPERMAAFIAIHLCLEHLALVKCWADGTAIHLAHRSGILVDQQHADSESRPPSSRLSAKSLSLTSVTGAGAELSLSLSFLLVRIANHSLRSLSLTTSSSSPRSSAILVAMNGSDTYPAVSLPHLTSLELPMEWMSSQGTIPLLTACAETLQQLAICCSRRSSGRRVTTPPPLDPASVDDFQAANGDGPILPRATRYRGPWDYIARLFGASLFLESVDLTLPCDPDEYYELLDTLRPSTATSAAGSNLASLAVRLSAMTGGMLEKTLEVFPNLGTLVVREPVLEPQDWVRIVGAPSMDTVDRMPSDVGVEPTSLDSPLSPSSPFTLLSSGAQSPTPALRRTDLHTLRFTSIAPVPQVAGFFVHPDREINPALDLVAHIHPSLQQRHPLLSKLTVVYNMRGASLVWRSPYRSLPRPPPLEFPVVLDPKDILVDVDVKGGTNLYGGNGQGRALSMDERRRIWKSERRRSERRSGSSAPSSPRGSPAASSEAGHGAPPVSLSGSLALQISTPSGSSGSGSGLLAKLTGKGVKHGRRGST